MSKRVLIEASLVEEAVNLPDETIEKKIHDYLEEYPPKIPWVKEIKRVTVKSL
ncbi:MAG: hypothetical protein NWF00_04950 [Candidatus Bathyarchaeota archaeon]|nr:hypothetical protein [Candidatus Bathyarchaeota archaeon]